MFSEAIDQANSIEQVVSIINSAKKGEDVLYYGGADMRSAEELAACYALDCAEDESNLSEMECHLDYLTDNGAEFDMSEAVSVLKKALAETN